MCVKTHVSSRNRTHNLTILTDQRSAHAAPLTVLHTRIVVQYIVAVVINSALKVVLIVLIVLLQVLGSK